MFVFVNYCKVNNFRSVLKRLDVKLIRKTKVNISIWHYFFFFIYSIIICRKKKPNINETKFFNSVLDKYKAFVSKYCFILKLNWIIIQCDRSEAIEFLLQYVKYSKVFSPNFLQSFFKKNCLSTAVKCLCIKQIWNFFK